MDEDGPHETLERRGIDLGRPGTKSQAHHGRSDLWRRSEGARGQRQQSFDICRQGGLQGQGAVAVSTGSRHQPVGDLLLQHHRCVKKLPSLVGMAQKAKEYRRRDVVRKIPGDPHGARFIPQQPGDIDVEEIRGDEVNVVRYACGQRRGQVAVDFDGDDTPDTRGERARQCATTRANLEERLVRRRGDDLNQLVDPGGFEEVLAETTARPERSPVTVRSRRRQPSRPASIALRFPRSLPH